MITVFATLTKGLSNKLTDFDQERGPVPQFGGHGFVEHFPRVDSRGAYTTCIS